MAWTIKYLTFAGELLRYSDHMTTFLYHELAPDSLDKVLTEGIKRSEQGQKTDREKQKVDTFLDTHLPEWAKSQGVCRANVIYGFLPVEDNKVIDIKDGRTISLEEFKAHSNQVLVRVKVDASACFVSDLDLYNTIARALELDEQDSTREHLADRYWERVIPLTDYEPGTITRPEVLIASEIEPKAIDVIYKD